MAGTNTTRRLDILVVGTGFYQGFNPVVAAVTTLLVGALVLALVAAPIASGNVLEILKHMTLTFFAGWYVYLLAIFVIFCLVLVMLPVAGRITLGPDGAPPRHSTAAWLSMMFCSGIGIGVLVFSVSEPISHFKTNPALLEGAVLPGSHDAAISAMRFVFLHWGLSAWACYAVTALALGLACHRFGQPMAMRSAVAPLFGKRLEGMGGHIVDVLSLMAIIAGITTTIVLGLEQICSGLSVLTGNAFFADQFGNPPLAALLTMLVVSISCAIGSIISGPHRGVKWVSQLGILIVFAVLLVFVIFGGGAELFNVFIQSSWRYVTTLPAQIATLYDPTGSLTSKAQSEWQNQWTVFYWAWWIAFSPFVGLFLARISYGRSVREFILGAMLAPAAMCFVWFSATGGSVLLMELDGRAAGRILEAEHAFRIYAAVDVMLENASSFAYVVKAVLVFLFLVLIIASSTAAIIAIKSIGAAGSDHGETPFHSMTWAVVIAAITGAVMAVGGVDSIRDVMIVGAVPFSFIMALMLISVVLMIVEAARTTRRALPPLGQPSVAQELQ